MLYPAFTALQTVQIVAPFNETEARVISCITSSLKGDDALRPTGALSFGERARLQLGLLVARAVPFSCSTSRSTTWISPRGARFEEALANFKGTILAVVHDRYFIERFATDIWNVRDGKIEKW